MSPEVQNRDIRGPSKRTYVLQIVLKIEAGEKELPRNSPSILFWIHHWQSRCQLSEFKTDQWNPTVLIFNFALWKVAVADPGFSRGGGVNPPGGAWTRQIFPKTAWNRKNLDAQGGACVPHAPPLDPPMGRMLCRNSRCTETFRSGSFNYSAP